ncbi:uncharacterized protein LOC144330243 [Macaca mulatta]
MALTRCGLKGVCIFLELSALCTFGSLRIAQGQEWHLGIVSPQKVPVGQQHLCPCGVSRFLQVRTRTTDAEREDQKRSLATTLCLMRKSRLMTHDQWNRKEKPKNEALHPQPSNL